MKSWTRRQFTQTMAAVTTTAALSSFRVLGANERVRIGCIGLGNRGDQVLTGFLKQPDAEIVALADINQPYLDFAARKIGTNLRRFTDYRRLLELKDMDAVVIATPDHWHALQTIHACEAGKDVYVEKPFSLCIAEGRAMVEAVHRHQRVCQVGTQRRSSAMHREVADVIRGGGIGKVTVVRCFHIQNEWPVGIGNPADSEPPAGFDWEAWLGPARKVKYNPNRGLYRFRWFYDYSGGQVTNMGVHYLDCIHWALGHHAPLAVAALGGRIAGIEDNREIPDTLEVTWQYPGGTLVTFSQWNATAAPAATKPCEIEYRGTKGTLYQFNRSWEVVPDALTSHAFPVRTPVDRQVERGWRAGEKPAIPARKESGDGDATTEHVRNFLDCVKSRAQCNAEVETGHRSTTTTLLANLALKTRSLLQWDAAAEKVTNHPAANRLLRYRYRAPYQFPT
ncbi:MAG TPA: Gfo/Idh/MocA family oxidoreductase [Verrucomicrobiota bacterium]|nr:Gfo/Idh/MocA family oxidoreductase [Verrucomicrobiota bacterium]HNT14349.1 Gfo/Idh/MocA family oxidoreductase [Verrucomicrobiota bacterium]